ncbi:nitronate monooxygenase [Alteromonadaceae bacterium M269]|nr:nitronate monooxygenase [Alteromonadaceae bacterium M269]
MITTQLTRRLNLKHPIISAPMAFAASGELAASVSQAGGLGLIGGGYGDIDWIKQQFLAANNSQVGCGFITWTLNKNPQVLDQVLELNPSYLCLSFGDPKPFAQTIKNKGVKLICQIQTAKDAIRAIECEADIIVAQGSEAGGHGEKRSTMTLVPEVADLIADRAPETLLCAAGGIADGRGLAAALMLGADGVMVGSRLWASREANVHQSMHQAALQASGDDTIRSQVMDIARSLDWPSRYNARVLKNPFTDKWHNDIAGLKANADVESTKWKRAWEEGDISIANTFVGEATGLIDEIEPVATIIEDMMFEAEHLLNQRWSI